MLKDSIDEIYLFLKVVTFFGKMIVPAKRFYFYFKDKKAIKGLTYENTVIGTHSKPPIKVNNYTDAFRHHAIRGSKKISRGQLGNGNKAKITLPQTQDEKTLVKFHTSYDYRVPFVGQYFIRDDAGNIKKNQLIISKAIFCHEH